MLVTHQTQWLHACDRVLVMRSGAIVADGPWAELAADPSLPELQQQAEATLADADVDALDAGQPQTRREDVNEQAVVAHEQLGGEPASSMQAERGTEHEHVELSGRPGGNAGLFETCASARGGEYAHTGAPAAHAAGQAADERAAPSSAPNSSAASVDSAPSSQASEPAQIRGSAAARSPVKGKAADSDSTASGAEGDSGAKLPAGLTSAEHRERGSVSRGVYGKYIRAVGLLSAVAVAAALAAGQSAWILSEWWLAQWSNESDEEQQDSKWLIVYGSLVAGALQA